MKGKAGMGGSKSTQTRFVGIIMSTVYIPTVDYSYQVPVDDSLVLSLTKRNSCYSVAIVMACRGGGLTVALATAWLVYSCTYSKRKCRDV